MVDIATWNRLSADEQAEYRLHSKDFIKAVLQSGVADGWQFEHNYYVESDGTFFFLTNGSGPFSGIRSYSRAVIEALLTDAAQNHGR